MFNTISPKVRVLQRLPLRILVRDSKEHNTGMFWAKYDLCIKGGFSSPVTHSGAVWTIVGAVGLVVIVTGGDGPTL